MTQGEITRASLQSEVIRRAWESMQFKQKLLARPREALQEMGYTLDEDVEVMVVQEHKKKLVLVLPESPLSTAQEEIMGPTIPASTHGCPQTLIGCEPTMGLDCQNTLAIDCGRPQPSFQCPPSTGSSCQPTSDCPRPPSTGSSCQPTSSCPITSAPDCTKPTADCQITKPPDCIRPDPTAICPPTTFIACPATMKVCPPDTWDCAPTMNCPPPPPTVASCSPNPGKP